MNDAAPAVDRRRIVVRGAVQLALGIALFAGLVWVIAPSWDAIRDRIAISIPWLLVALTGSVIANAVTAARWKLLSETMGAMRLPYGVYFHWLALTRLVGQVLPTMLVDVFGRSAALKAAGSTSRLGQLVTPLVLERLLDLLLPLAMLAWALGIHARPISDAAAWGSLAALVVVFSALSVPLLAPMVAGALRLHGALLRLRREPEVDTTPARVSPALSARIVVLSVCRYAAILVQYWGAGAGFGVVLPALVLASAAPLAQLAGLVGLTPGGLGVQEGGWVAALSQLGQDEASIVVMMAATRVMMVVNFAVLSVASWRFRRA